MVSFQLDPAQTALVVIDMTSRIAGSCYRLRFFLRDCLTLLLSAFFCPVLRFGLIVESVWEALNSCSVEEASIFHRLALTSSADFKPNLTWTSTQLPMIVRSTYLEANARSIIGAASLACSATSPKTRKAFGFGIIDLKEIELLH